MTVDVLCNVHLTTTTIPLPFFLLVIYLQGDVLEALHKKRERKKKCSRQCYGCMGKLMVLKSMTFYHMMHQ